MPGVELEYVESDSQDSVNEIFYDVESYILHKAAFNNDISRLLNLLKEKAYDIIEKDAHGNTPLHLAIMLGHKECVKLLLAHDATVAVKNALGWNSLAESISYGDRETITMVLKKLKQQSRVRIEERQPDLTNALGRIDDFYVEIKWDFHSWIPLISRFLPNDVCKVYKNNGDVRIDSTLMDFHEMRWQRGDLSFIFHGATREIEGKNKGRESKRQMYVLDNRKKKYSHISAVETDKDIEEEVDILMSSDVVSANISTKPITFTRLQGGWVYKHDKCEDIGSFNTSVYTVNGMVLNSRKRREHLTKEDVQKNKAALESISKGSVQWLQQQEELPKGRGSLQPPDKPAMSWEQYIMEKGELAHGKHIGRPIMLKQDKKPLKANIWMTEDFPVKVEILLNILEVMAPFKHFSKLKDFIQLKIPPGFPVKVEVPVLPTIAATVTFQSYAECDHDKSMFEIPDNYQEDSAHFSNM